MHLLFVLIYVLMVMCSKEVKHELYAGLLGSILAKEGRIPSVSDFFSGAYKVIFLFSMDYHLQNLQCVAVMQNLMKVS